MQTALSWDISLVTGETNPKLTRTILKQFSSSCSSLQIKHEQLMLILLPVLTFHKIHAA